MFIKITDFKKHSQEYAGMQVTSSVKSKLITSFLFFTWNTIVKTIETCFAIRKVTYVPVRQKNMAGIPLYLDH